MYLIDFGSALLAVASLFNLVAAGGVPQRHGPPGAEKPAKPVSGNSTFQQLIDHNKPSLGTFSQFYYYNDTFWTPGAPVVLFTPGEIAALPYTSYLTPRRLTGTIAEAIGGAVIVLEHRYWGVSSPFSELTTENMTYLTLENSIADLTHFAETVNLPFDPKHTSRPSKAPWVLVGGSYSGALTAWTASVAPGTFWAYLATSAVVQAQYDFWQYFVPVQEGMPKNCSKDVSLVVDYIDNILVNGTKKQQHDLKASFGLAGVEHNDDFASAIIAGPGLWQSNQFYTDGGFFEFCDFVENANGTNATIPGGKGVGVQKALAGYAYWFNATVLPGYCAGYGYWSNEWDVSCFNSYNASSPIYTDLTVSNPVDRQWEWMLCNEPFGWFQDAAPVGTPSLVSRLVTADYYQRQCSLYFPTQNGYTFGSNKGRTEADVNAYTQGWEFTNSTRLWWTNGQYDPWRDVTMSSDFRPEGKLHSTNAHPLRVIPGAYHCSDLITMNGVVNAGVKAVQDAEVAQMVKWVKQFKP